MAGVRIPRVDAINDAGLSDSLPSSDLRTCSCQTAFRPRICVARPLVGASPLSGHFGIALLVAAIDSEKRVGRELCSRPVRITSRSDSFWFAEGEGVGSEVIETHGVSEEHSELREECDVPLIAPPTLVLRFVQAMPLLG